MESEVCRTSKVERLKLYDFLTSNVKKGNVVTYSELSDLIGRDVRHPRSLLSYVMHAVRTDGYEFIVITGHGYRLPTDAELAHSGHVSIKRVKRSIRKGLRMLRAIEDFESLSNEDKIAHNTSVSVLGALDQFTGNDSIRRIESKVEQDHAKLSLGDTLKMFYK